ALAKLKFQVTHRGPSWNKKYTISRISTKSAAETFFKVDGKNKSVAQHFQDMYQIELRFPNLPCVVVESDPARKMEVPFEVCEIPDVWTDIYMFILSSGIRHKGRLTGPQTADIIRQTAARPQERKGKILDLLKLVSDGQKKDNTWNLKLDNKMAVVDGMSLFYECIIPLCLKQDSYATCSFPARVLIEPELQYGGKFVRPRQGAWNTVGYKAC
ncbi:PAZ domain-containing protein, partial [Endogone sp. FLAS-F59071]